MKGTQEGEKLKLAIGLFLLILGFIALACVVLAPRIVRMDPVLLNWSKATAELAKHGRNDHLRTT